MRYQVTPIAAPSDSMVSPSKTTKSPRKSAKGKDKAVDSDVDPETDDEGRVAPSRRPKSARQTALEKDPKAFLRRQVEKSKRERQAALAAEESSAANDTETKSTTKPAKKSATKKSAPTKRTPAATKSSEPSTIQDGKIAEGAKAKKQPEKPKRDHRKKEFGYETVPDDSDDGEKQRDTIAKLRETINRHARWCPFVRLKKQLHRTHRRTSRLEISDSEATMQPLSRGKTRLKRMTRTLSWRKISPMPKVTKAKKTHSHQRRNSRGKLVKRKLRPKSLRSN